MTSFTEEQDFLRETARRFLDDRAPISLTRTLMETDHGFDEKLWRETAALGWQAMAIPEEYGGAGFTTLELGILMEEMGRSLAPLPFLSTIVLGADLVLRAGTEEQRKALLGEVAAGERRLAVAHMGEGGRWDRSGVGVAARREDGGLLLEGAAAYVLDGHTADTLIVAATLDQGLVLVVVDGDLPGVDRRRVETMDMTRKQAAVSFDGVRVPGSAILGGDDDSWPALRATLTNAAVALAFEQVGGAQECLDMAVDYAKVRVQFGRPIGSFQAIKHKCADMLVEVEAAKSAAYHAGRVAAAGDEEELAVAAPLAKAYCSEAFFHCASENIQIHGGIGFTWEHDAHLYFKRAKTDELLFGTPAEHRARLGDRLGL